MNNLTFFPAYIIITVHLGIVLKMARLIKNGSLREQKSSAEPVSKAPSKIFNCFEKDFYVWIQFYKIQIKSKGVTMTALLAKATALALVKHPVVNSSCRYGNSFTYNSSINIAVAVATEGRLITPVL
ncbi:hypothetical protein AHAS_Ahas05G0186400 [Arachis hypogaea]